ncbi:hypothetical protein DY000_02010219 [Brassica cretica]|uniref:Secreted protein n=1 Tax=Brassica cretica TaxID=69181 RepID=A0ABQ7BT28_BRACR|nr:hypothetical protein DY000_02010219 [Brassica cretica]
MVLCFWTLVDPTYGFHWRARVRSYSLSVSSPEARWFLWQRVSSHETASASHGGLCHLVLGSEFVAARRSRSPQ